MSDPSLSLHGTVQLHAQHTLYGVCALLVGTHVQICTIFGNKVTFLMWTVIITGLYIDSCGNVVISILSTA